jgi:ubiquinone/menaquinone biosynthesis C-methylase UbiE
MAFSKQIASQLFKPSGLIGRFILPRLWNKRNRALNDFVFELLELRSTDRILEVGFGGGYLLDRIQNAVHQGMAAGVDLSSLMITYFKKKHWSFFRDGRFFIAQVNTELLPFVPESFSKVCTVNTLFYVKDIQQALSEFYRILMKNGTAVICFTDKKDLESRSFARHGLRLYESQEVQQMMTFVGFHSIRMICKNDRYRVFHCAVGIK